MKKTYETKSESNIVFYCLLAILAIVFANICKVIFVDFNNYLNSDIVAEMKFVRTVVEDGNLFTQNWVGSHENFLSRPWFVAVPIYILTNSITLAYKIANIITAGMILGSFYLLTRKLEFKKETSIFSCIILLSFFNLETDIAMYTLNAYAVFIIMILVSLYIFIDVFIEVSKECKNRKAKLIGLIIIAFYAGVCSERLLLYLYMPLVIWGIYIIYKELFKQNDIVLSKYKKELFTILLLAVNVIGIIIGKKVFVGSYVQYFMNMLGMEEVLSNIGIPIISLFVELFIPTGVTMNSINGLLFMMKSGIYVLIIVSIINIFRYKENGKRNFVIFVIIISLVSAYAYMIMFLDENIIIGSTRYFILARYLVSIMIGYVLEYFADKKMVCGNLKISVLSIIMALIVSGSLINIKIFDEVFSRDSNITKKEVAKYLVDKEYSVALATYWNSSIIEGLTDGVIETGSIDINGNNIQSNIWLVDKKIYDEADSGIFKAALLLTDEEEDMMQDGYLKYNLREIEKKEIDNYNVYDMADVKLDLFIGLPTEETNIDYPYSIGIGTTNGDMDTNGNLVTEGKGGYVLYGPYTHTQIGIYNFTLHYEVIESKDDKNPGKFDVVTNTGENMYGEAILDSNKSTVTIQNVEFENNDEILEYRVYLNEGSKVKISKIEIEKVEE